MEGNNDISEERLWAILDNMENNIKKLDNNISDNLCINCNSNNVIYSNDYNTNICYNCGLHSNEILDDSPEWNNFEDNRDISRCGPPTSAFFPKSSLGTTINTPGYSKMKMLRIWSQIPYKERSLSEVLNEIDYKCKPYKITKAVIDNTKILYKNIREIKYDTGENKGKNIIIRGINRKQIIAACLFFGAMLQKSPRSAKEVAQIFDLNIKQITKGCRNFLELMKDNFILFNIKPFHGSDFIERFGTAIKISKDSINLAKIISENTYRLDIASDHQPTSIAAACILLSSNILNETINTKIISDIFKISEVTIKRTHIKISEYKNIVISTEKTTKILNIINLEILNIKLLDDDDESDVIKKNKKNKDVIYDEDNIEIKVKKKCGRPKKIYNLK